MWRAPLYENATVALSCESKTTRGTVGSGPEPKSGDARETAALDHPVPPGARVATRMFLAQHGVSAPYAHAITPLPCESKARSPSGSRSPAPPVEFGTTRFVRSQAPPLPALRVQVSSS